MAHMFWSFKLVILKDWKYSRVGHIIDRKKEGTIVVFRYIIYTNNTTNYPHNQPKLMIIWNTKFLDYCICRYAAVFDMNIISISCYQLQLTFSFIRCILPWQMNRWTCKWAIPTSFLVGIACFGSYIITLFWLVSNFN